MSIRGNNEEIRYLIVASDLLTGIVYLRFPRVRETQATLRPATVVNIAYSL